MVYAATALHEHNFNLKENLQELTQEQQSYIYNILIKCLNKGKMDSILKELGELQPAPGTLGCKWLQDFREAYIHNFSQHKPLFSQTPRMTRSWINNLIRLVGKTSLLEGIQI